MKKLKKCKLVRIANRKGHPKFHIEIEEKLYFYGFRGIRADDKIVLYCNHNSCWNRVVISPLEFLKQLIHDSPTNRYGYSKILDISDPKAYDINNYDLNSLEIRGSHKCPGTDPDLYIRTMHLKR
jgi:hypothetical protein